VVEFDQPRAISRLVYEVHETVRERTQEVRLEASDDGGRTYCQILVQGYNFSPRGATFQRETSALIYGRLPISVSRLFQTRAAQARRLSRHCVSSLRRLPVSKLERLLSR
jgi:hypothetical protein